MEHTRRRPSNGIPLCGVQKGPAFDDRAHKKLGLKNISKKSSMLVLEESLCMLIIREALLISSLYSLEVFNKSLRILLSTLFTFFFYMISRIFGHVLIFFRCGTLGLYHTTTLLKPMSTAAAGPTLLKLIRWGCPRGHMHIGQAYIFSMWNFRIVTPCKVIFR